MSAVKYIFPSKVAIFFLGELVAENTVLLLPILLHFILPKSLHFFLPITQQPTWPLQTVAAIPFGKPSFPVPNAPAAPFCTGKPPFPYRLLKPVRGKNW